MTWSTGRVWRAELELLYRGILVTTGDPVAAEHVARSAGAHFTGEAVAPTRAELWSVAWRRADRASAEPVQPLLVRTGGLDLDGEAARLQEFLTGGQQLRARVLVGRHVGGLEPGAVARSVGRSGGPDDITTIDAILTAGTEAASRHGVAEPERWSEVVAHLEPPGGLLTDDPARPGFVTTVGVGLVIVGLLAAVLSWEGSERSVDREGAADSGADLAPIRCPAEDLAAAIDGDPSLVGGSAAVPLDIALAQADAVITADVTSLETEGATVRFDLGRTVLLHGSEGVTPSGFAMPARLAGTGTDLGARVVAFLARSGDDWELAESGGLWAEPCRSDGPPIPVGAAWPVGERWPATPSPSSIAGFVGDLVVRDRELIMTDLGDRLAGGLVLTDGTAVIMELPTSFATDLMLSATVAPDRAQVVFAGTDVALSLRQRACPAGDRTTERGRRLLTVCSPSGGVELSARRSDPIPDHEVATFRVTSFPAQQRYPTSLHPTIRAGRELALLDADRASIRWIWTAEDVIGSADLVGGLVVVTTPTATRTLIAETGDESWALDSAISQRPTVVGPHWLVTRSVDGSGVVERLDPTSAAVLWRRAALDRATIVGVLGDVALVLAVGPEGDRILTALAVDSGRSLWTRPVLDGAGSSDPVAADPDRGIVLAVDPDGLVSRVEPRSGREIWTTSVPGATGIVGIWLNTATVEGSTTDVRVGLIDGFILPP